MKIIIESSELQPLFDKLMKAQLNLENCHKTDCSNLFIVSEVLGMLQRIVESAETLIGNDPNLFEELVNRIKSLEAKIQGLETKSIPIDYSDPRRCQVCGAWVGSGHWCLGPLVCPICHQMYKHGENHKCIGRIY